MAVWDEKKFNQSLTQNNVNSLYLLYGEEVYLLDEAVNSLMRTALGDGLRDFNLSVFYGQEASGGQVRDAVETLPMMAQRRVVILKEGQDFKAKDYELLSPVIQNPVESTTFIIVSTKVDKRKRFFKEFEKSGVVVEFRKPYENQVPAWIKFIGQKHGLAIGDSESLILNQLVGSSLLSLDNEIRKLSQYLGDRKSVTAKDIHQIVSHSRVDSVFDLANAIGDRDQASALVCLANLLEHGQNEVGALALVTRHVRILATLQEGMKEGLAGVKLSARAGVPQFFLKRYMDQCRRWTPQKINKTYEALLDTDRALKSSPLSSHIWLENFVIRTCAS